MEYFIKNKIIEQPILFHKGVRDDPSINVFKDIHTGALVLDKIRKQNYETNGLSYWNSENIIDARNSTYNDDLRRYNQLKNINFNNLLDFGCGNGGLLKIIKNNNKDKNIVGVELNNELVKYLNAENITCYNKIHEIPSNYNFNCIMLNHVLEHLHEPIETLKKIKDKMNSKTLLIIEVPHADDFLISEYNCNKFKNFTFWSEHLILHTENSLIKLLNIAGFSNIQITYYQRYNIFNHLCWLSNGTPGGDKTTNFNDDELINTYNNFLIKQKKTDTIIAYCYI